MTEVCTTDTYAHPITRETVDAGYSGHLTVTRAAGKQGAGELVFIDSDLLAGQMSMTPEQAADLAETLHRVSGMASSTRGAEFLAESVRKGMAYKGVSRHRAQTVSGISRRRLDKILSGSAPMTETELKALADIDRQAGR